MYGDLLTLATHFHIPGHQKRAKGNYNVNVVGYAL